MNYLISDEHIHAKDEEHVAIAIDIIDKLDMSSMYAPALKKIFLEISDYYTSYDSELARYSKELIRVEQLRQRALALHAHYPITKESRIALLGLIVMLKTDLHTEMEKLNEEE